MGFFDALFGSRNLVIEDPDRLREALFDAVAKGDLRQLEKRCRANQKRIVELFPAWQKVPESVRHDPSAMPRYAAGLIEVAKLFAERLATPALLQRLVGDETSNPLVAWQKRLGEARDAMGELRYVEARDLLTNLLIDARELSGSGVDRYQPITLGFLGECFFQGGEAEKAIPHMEEALRLCEASGDMEGIVAYLGNLHEVHRYLARADAAASYAEKLAAAFEKCGRTADANRYRKLAPIVRAGEPLNRVVAVVNNVRFELDELRDLRDKHIQFIFERNRITLRPATQLTQEGERLGSEGKYEEALARFRDAARADPFDPNCRYQEGFSLMHLSRYAEAAESYRTTEELAPGWFHCRADLWLAEQLTLGAIDHPVFLATTTLEDAPQSPGEKVALADSILARCPNFAPAHLERGKNLARLNRPKDAMKAYRAGLACVADPDVKTRLLLQLGILVEERNERADLLRQAEALNGNLVAAASAMLALRNEAAG
jgi:tetratricopeptide (TPR) repeat protein